MRFTSRLCQQHLGFMFKKHWLIQGRRVIRDTGALAELEKFNIKVTPAKNVITPKFERRRLDIIGPYPLDPPNDEAHPDWHDTECLIYGDSNVLLEGIPQAQVLLKTIEINNLPKSYMHAIDKVKIPKAVDKNVQNAILASHCFDTQQEKTAIVKIPERPAYVLPRNYGITDSRKNRLILAKLVFECEKLAGRSTSCQRSILENADFSINLHRDSDLLQFELRAEQFITSKRPLEPIKESVDHEIPDIYPLQSTITIPRKNIYKLNDHYPVPKQINVSNPHTICLHYSPLEVKNLHETPVTESQYYGRTLLKAFAVAGARAKQVYGSSVGDLPKPIVVQAIQTDGKSFHFGVFQLNTLNIDDSEGVKNYWFHLPKMNLFDECLYQVGKPVLEGYNPEVIKYMTVFYNS